MINTSSASFRQDILGPILQEGFPEDVYIAHQVLPPIPVQKRFGIIPTFMYSNDQAMSLKRAPKSSYARIQSELGQATYACAESGLEEFLSPEDYEILGKDFAEMLIGRRLVHNVLRARDIALAAALFSGAGATLFANTVVNAAITWDAAGGLPLNDILQAKRNIALQTGVPGNCLLIGYDLYIALCKNPQIQTLVRNVMGYGGPEFTVSAVMNEIPTKVLAMTFGLDEVIVARDTVNAAGEAATIGGTPNRSFVWPSQYALVFRKSRGGQDLREVSMGRLFIYDLAMTMGALAVGTMDTARGLVMEWYRKEDINADAFRVREYSDMEILVPNAGSLITNTHS